MAGMISKAIAVTVFTIALATVAVLVVANWSAPPAVTVLPMCYPGPKKNLNLLIYLSNNGVVRLFHSND